MSGEPPGWRHKTHEEASAGLTIEVWEIARKACLPLDPELWEAAPPALAALRIVQAAANPLAHRQICLRLTGEGAGEGGGVVLEPNAFQYAKGRISAALQKNANAGDRLARRITAATTGDVAHATRFAGRGEIWTHPSEQHFMTMTMHGPEDALLLDTRAFYACAGSIDVGTHVHGSAQGLLSGNGIMQTRLSGRGVLVMKCPVPPAEVVAIALDGGDELTVQGDLMLAYSASLEVTLRPLVRGAQNVIRSVENLAYTVRGRGKVLLMPTRALGA
jgi:uncharacterized protein (AIM24 family)